MDGFCTFHHQGSDPRVTFWSMVGRYVKRGEDGKKVGVNMSGSAIFGVKLSPSQMFKTDFPRD